MTPSATDKKYPVLLLAGRRPGVDPIADYFGKSIKVLAPIAGKPMITHILHSLVTMECVSDIYVLTQDPAELESAISEFSVNRKIKFCQSGKGIAESILSVWKGNNISAPFLITTADNCLIRQEHVNNFIEQSQKNPSDLSVGLVEKNILTGRYPESRRTWLKFKDRFVTGCNLFLIQNNQAENIISYWKAFESSPKKVFRLAWSVGPVVFLRYFLKRLHLSEAFKIISSKLNANIYPLVLNDPDIAIDADKVSDIVQIESILNLQDGQSGTKAKDPHGALVIFDLDRTITTHGTFLPFLLYFAVLKRPVRLLMLPFVIVMMLGYLLRIISRKKLKTYMQAMLIGRVEKNTLNKVCENYVNRVLESKVNLDALFTIRQWQSEDAKLVIATASFDWMARCFASRLGIDNCIGSVSVEKNGMIIPGIDGENCYGEAKLRAVEKSFGSLNSLKESKYKIWCYTDHHSDIPLLELCTNPVAVNPTTTLFNWVNKNPRARATYWNTNTVSSSYIKNQDAVSET